jgi:serine/threonine-protein kinase
VPFAAAEPADDAKGMMKQAKELTKKQHYEEALAVLNRAVTAAPGEPEVRLRRAQVYLELKKPAEALVDLDAVLKFDPENRNAIIERARAFEAKGMRAEALKECDRALAIKKDGAVYQVRAELLEKAGRIAEAIADYDQLIRYQPFRADLYLTRGKLHRQNGDGKKAGLDFGQAIRLNPTYTLQVARAINEASGKSVVTKPTLASVVLQAKPAAPEISQHSMDRVLVVQNKGEKAKKTRDKREKAAAPPKPAPVQVAAVEAPPPDPELEKLAREREQAAAAAAKASEEQKQANAVLQAGRNQLAAGQYAEAIASLSQYIAARPKLPEGYMRRCAAHFLSGSYPAAIEDCNKAISIQSLDADSYYWRARTEQAQGDLAKAADDFTMAIELKPYNPDAHFHRAQVHAALDNLSGAIYGYSEAARQKQGFTEAIQARAELRLALGDKRGHEADVQLLQAAAKK